jgi:glycosyltransferase involved in cell wall biosynthesis
VSGAGKPKTSVGLKLLNLSAWIRRQPWLKGIYRHLPQPLRNKVSEKLASRASTQIKFLRTKNWERRVRRPASPNGDGVRRGEFGAAAGVNVFAYARGQSGLGESARLYVRALLGEGYPVAVHNIDINIPHGMDDVSLEGHIGMDTPYGVNLVFVNPDCLGDAIASVGRERLAGRYTIACWFWELEKFPEEWLPALKMVDEIMVSSGFIGEVIRSVTDKPMLHVPLPVDEVDDSGLTRADLGLEDDAFIFLNSFDFNSFLTRKNPFAVIDAFRHAFTDGRADVRLLIKSSNGHRHPDKLRELLDATAGDWRILVRDEVIDRNDVQALQRCADAYVSLHRAEGFGLGLAECMRLGKPVIATAWSGNMEFMTPENSCLVNYRLVPVGEGEYLHYVGQRWADPDVNHAATYMRRLVDDREFAARIGAQAAIDIRDKLSPRSAAELIIQRLKALSVTSGTSNTAGAGSAAVAT